MTKLSTITAAQALNATIAGMRSAPAVYPPSLPASDLPLALSAVGPGVVDWESHAGDYIRDGFTLIVTVYVAPLGQGMGVDEGMRKAITLLDATLAKWRTAGALSNGAEVDIDRPGIRHSGVRNDLQYSEPDTYYRGFRLEIPVYERIED